MAAALAGLPDPLRETVILKLWAGLTYPEIAASTGVPVPTATSRYLYTLDRLRQCPFPSLHARLVRAGSNRPTHQPTATHPRP